jgi:hypothetical protein
MRPTRRPNRLRTVVGLAALTLAAVAASVPAAAVADPASVGSSQRCVGTTGGFLLEVNGFGTSFPPNTTGTTTFRFANGQVVSLDATTTDEGIYHTARFTLDLRDPTQAALIGTQVFESGDFAGVTNSFYFELVGCPTAPDGKVACLDDGYLSYPALGFLNQGDCVSWIATQGKNELGKNVL